MKLFEVSVSVPNKEDRVILVSAQDDQEVFVKLKNIGVTQDQITRILVAIPDFRGGPVWPFGAPEDVTII